MRSYVPNLRDVGGLPIGTGGSVRPGKVLRSALPSKRDRAPEGVSWPPTLVIDLRSPGEGEVEHPLQSPTSRVVNLPLLSTLAPDVAFPPDLAGLYLLMLQTSQDYLVDVVREVAESDGPTLVHCAAGKDRTGVSIALILRLVGVDREVVIGDYLATNESSADIEKRLRKVYGRRNRATVPKAFFAVPVEAIEGVLDVWDAHEGGVHGWFGDAGGDEALVESLRDAIVDQ